MSWSVVSMTPVATKGSEDTKDLASHLGLCFSGRHAARAAPGAMVAYGHELLLRTMFGSTSVVMSMTSVGTGIIGTMLC